MSKQVNFYASKDDNIFILNTLNSTFDIPLEAPHNFDDGFQPLENIINNPRCYITESARKQDIVYEWFEFYDNTKERLINYRKSPVLEYHVPTKAKAEQIEDILSDNNIEGLKVLVTPK